MHSLCSFDGILFECGGEDNLHVLGYNLCKFQTTDLLHVDGEKKYVEMVVMDAVYSIYRTFVGSDQMQGRSFLYILFQELQSFWIFIYDGAILKS